MGNYTPHSNLARLLYNKQKADLRLHEYNKTLWYTVKEDKIRADLFKLFVRVGAGPDNNEPDDAAKTFLTASAEKSDSLFLQAWHSFACSALSWFLSRTSINGLLGRGTMHVISGEQFQKLMQISGYTGPWNSVIDLGAGDGNTTAHIATFFDKVYATEISLPMRWALAKRKFTVLDIETWPDKGPFNVILCLNLLDRCDRPNTLLKQLKKSLVAGGRLVIALVLPFSPYVEVGERDDHNPVEQFPIEGNSLEVQIDSLVDKVFEPLGFKCKVWTKVPYLCEGDLGQAYYFLNDVIFVLEPDSNPL